VPNREATDTNCKYDFCDSGIDQRRDIVTSGVLSFWCFKLK